MKSHATRSARPHSLLVTALATSLLLSACGGGGGGGSSSNTVALRGSIGDGYQLARAPGLFDRLASWVGIGSLQAQQALDTVDQVVAIPTNNGNVDAGIYALIQRADINSDGGFELELDTSYDWVLLLVNSQSQSLDDKVVAYISIPATSGEGIENLPASESNGSAIDLGSVNPSPSLPQQADSSSDAGQLAQKLSLTQADLEEMAHFDDSYRHLFNLYLNHDPASGDYYLALPEARWKGLLQTGLGTDPDYNSSSLGGLDYEGFFAAVSTDSSPAVGFSDFCDGTVDLSVFPPTTMTIEGRAFGPGTGLSGATATINPWSPSYCGNDFMSMEKQAQGDLTIQFPLGSEPMPAGLWRMKWNDQTIAAFDFSLANPVDDAGRSTGLVPRFILHPDASDGDRIAAITIEWYQLGSNGWDPVQDDSLLDTLVRASFVEFVDYTPGGALGNGENKNFQQYDEQGLISGEITLPDTYAWYLANHSSSLPDNAAEVTELSISYEMAGISYRYTWSNSSN